MSERGSLGIAVVKHEGQRVAVDPASPGAFFEQPITHSWRELILEAMQKAGDKGPIRHCTLSDAQMDERFRFSSYIRDGGFTLWTASRVYFPVVYDGHEWVGSVPRFPCDEKTPHQGGG